MALAAGHKGLALAGVDVEPDDRSPVEAASGQPLVPVLLDGDDAIADSPAIVEHLERRFPEPPLYRAEPARRAEVETFLDWFNDAWKRAPNLIAAELELPTPNTSLIAVLGARMRASVDRFEALLSGRDFSSATSASPT